MARLGIFDNNCIPEITILFEKNDLPYCLKNYPNTKPLLFKSPKHLLFEASQNLINKYKKIISYQLQTKNISIALQPLLPNIKNLFFELLLVYLPLGYW